MNGNRLLRTLAVKDFIHIEIMEHGFSKVKVICDCNFGGEMFDTVETTC